VVRRLPPAWTSEMFIEQISPIPEHDYLHFVPGDVRLATMLPCFMASLDHGIYVCCLLIRTSSTLNGYTVY